MKQQAKKALETYSFKSEGIPVQVSILREPKAFVPTYEIKVPGIGVGTKAIMETKLRAELLSMVDVDLSELLDPKKAEEIKEKFYEGAKQLLHESFKEELSESNLDMLATYLVQHTIGLGDLDILLSDEMLEEVVINGPGNNVWVYHKKFGWCKTNLKIRDDEEIYNYASLIARKVGRQINVLNPLLDAHIYTGDRVNATLFPISSSGNTLTIRKFSKNPWTVSNLIATGTVSSDVMALIWLCIQNELSLIVSGGTGSGKTSFLNAIAGLIPANQRVISIEDTRELTLPKYLQWVPMVTREPNPEGKGEVTMLDLLVNSLRMRPDRILVGEIRRQREAEVMFEAMHTGHSVYATLHADNAEQTISRLLTPPINLPAEVLDAVAGIVVQFRHRRYNIRRTLEFAEVHRKGELNEVYRWDSKEDMIKRVGSLDRISKLIGLYTGMTPKEIEADVEEKAFILDWMVNRQYYGIDAVGHIVSTYYNYPEEVISAAEKNKKWVFE